MKSILSFFVLMLFASAYCTTASAQTEANNIPVNPDKPYTWVEQMPQYIGGNKALLMHLKQYLKKAPVSQGSVIVSFVIHEDSTISDIVLLKPLNKAVDDLIVQAVGKMNGHWIPGSQFGTLVKVSKVLPISLPLTATSIGEVEVRGVQ